MTVISTIDYLHSIIHFYILCVIIIVPTISYQLNGAAALNDKELVLPEPQFTIENFVISAQQDKDIQRLVFEPSILEFEKLAVGETAHKIVTIINNHTNQSVYLGTISGSVPEFQSSFFDANFIPPMGNATFNVVFLPRYQMPVMGHLTIQTSFGIISYMIRGNGTECPYRLNPLIGLVAPMNAVITPEIYMYNPYSTPIQIVEIYSSGGQFQLELPTGTEVNNKKAATDGNKEQRSQSVWTIPAYYSKPIIRIRFTAITPGKHLAYIRIKISSKSVKGLRNKVLIVPIEVECLKEPGLYSSLPLLDLGIAGINDRHKDFTLKLKSSDDKPREILSYHVETEPEIQNAITVKLVTKENAADSLTNAIINVIVAWSKISANKLIRGFIAVKTKSKRDASEPSADNHNSIYKIPFMGEIIPGSVHYNETIAKFRLVDDISRTRQFRVRNDYQVPLAITNLTFDAFFHKSFQIDGFQAKVLAPGEDTSLFNVTLLPSTSIVSAALNMYLHSNISTYDVQFIIFTGNLRRLLPINDLTNITRSDIDGLPDEKLIDFGTLPLATKSHVTLGFVNQNPLPISINNWKGTISSAATIEIILRGCGRMQLVDLKFCDRVQEDEWIIFQLSVSSNAVGTFVGLFTVKTEYEEINTPIKFSTDMGVLKFSTMMMGNEGCFQGGVCTVNLTAHSTFMQTIKVDSIQTINLNGTHYNYTKTNHSIGKSTETPVAIIDFVPPKLCGHDCAVEYPDRWSPAAIIDYFQTGKTSLLSHKLRLFRRLKTEFTSIRFHVQTNFIKHYDFNGSIELTWPRLSENQIDFPITQTGHEAVQYVSVRNPTNETLVVYYTLHEFTDANLATHLPAEVVSDCWNCFLTRDPVFSFVDTNIRNLRIQNIPPKTNTSVAVQFAPVSAGNFSTLLYIRNNLTIIEAVWVLGKAALPDFKFGNRKPGSKTSLLFELTEKTLFDCNQASLQMAGYTIKRTFTAKNSGETVVRVHGFHIDDMECEGYGYRILDCEPFDLAPNASKKIGIAFSPDFTLAVVRKILHIDTSLGYSINYTLLSLISPLCLEACSKILPRPYWESLLKIVSACIAVITFLCVLLAAYLDAMKNLQSHLKNLSKAKGVLQPALDLRQIGSMKLSSNDAKEKEAIHLPANTVKSPVSNAAAIKINNANTKKQKAPYKKRTDNVIVENGSAKPKPWTIELAERVTEKILGEKSDDSKSKNVSPSEKVNKKPKDKMRLKLIPSRNETDEEVLSTSTENSNQSDDKPPPRDSLKKGAQADVLDTKDKQGKKAKKTSPQSRGKPAETSSTPDLSGTKINAVLPKTSAEQETINSFTDDLGLPLNAKRTSSKPNSPDPIATNKKPLNKKKVEIGDQPKSSDGKTVNPLVKRDKLAKEAAVKPVQGNGYHQPQASIPQPTPITPSIPNRISFSRIVQNQSPNSLSSLPHSTSASPTLRESMSPGLIDRPSSTGNSFASDHVPYLNESYERMDNTHSPVDLGPIGTRKTQSGPMWRPLGSMPGTSSPLHSMLTSNANHFNNNDNHANNMKFGNQYGGDNNSGSDYFMGNSSGRMHGEPNSSQADQKQRIWDSALLLDILQQRQNIQEQQNDRIRIPSSYAQSQMMQSSNTNLTEFQRFYMHGNNSMWNPEQTYNNNANRQHMDERWSNSPTSHSHQIRPPPGLGHIVIRSQNNGEQQSYGNETAEMPPYNPFNTLSSIWSSDSWPTNLSNRNNDQQQL